MYIVPRSIGVSDVEQSLFYASGYHLSTQIGIEIKNKLVCRMGVSRMIDAN